MSAKVEFDKSEIKYIVKSYNNGYTLKDIADEYGLSMTVIKRVLLESGVTLRPRGRQPQNF